MNIDSLKNCVSHEEATIQSFVKDPEFADYLMEEVLKDGDEDEVKYFQELYDEAKFRSFGMLAQA